MKHRLDRLLRNARLDRPRIGLVSMWDVENNAVRILAATLRAAGHKVVEIYFKDWISNKTYRYDLRDCETSPDHSKPKKPIETI